MSEPAKDEAELIERVAVAACECGGKCYVMDGATWCSASDKESVIVILAAIRAAGWAVVPVEPTDEMLWAADRAPVPECEMDNPDHLDFVLFAVRRAEWSAMLAAAPGVKP